MYGEKEIALDGEKASIDLMGERETKTTGSLSRGLEK